MRIRGDGGQAMPLAIAAIVVAGLLTIAVGSMAGDVVDAARAQTAADAAALASIGGGRAAASSLAVEHGGTVVAWSQQGSVITVSVRIGDAVGRRQGDGWRATARHRLTGLPEIAPGPCLHSTSVNAREPCWRHGRA